MADICIDSAFIPAQVGKIYSRWCHLFTDEPRNPEALESLHRFAASLGLRRSWYQAGSILPHYDVTENMRIKAVRFGAREVTREEVREVMTKMYGTWKFLPDMG
jgi:hypothetical protein